MSLSQRPVQSWSLGNSLKRGTASVGDKGVAEPVPAGRSAGRSQASQRCNGEGPRLPCLSVTECTAMVVSPEVQETMK
jgi:hypothetical protein